MYLKNSLKIFCLKIIDGKSHTFGKYCGERSGESVVVAGEHVMITFHSDDIEQRRGFLIFITAVPLGTFIFFIIVNYDTFHCLLNNRRRRPKVPLMRSVSSGNFSHLSHTMFSNLTDLVEL